MNLSKGSTSYLTSSNLLLLLGSVAGVGMAIVMAQMPLLVIVSGLILACSFWLMQKAVGVFNLRVQTIPGCCYLVYVGTVLVPSFFVYADQHDPFRRTYLFAVESALLTIPLGILFAKQIFQFYRSETMAYFRSAVHNRTFDPGPEVYLLLLVLAWMITCLYVLEVRTIPLFYMFAHPGEYRMLARLREESLKLLNSPLRYVYNILSSSLYPLLIVFGFGRFLQTKRRLWAVLFMGSLIPGLLFAAFTTAKAPAAAICVMLCLYFYFHRSGRIGTKFILLFLTSLLGFPLFVIMQVYAGLPESSLVSAFQSVGHRLFYLPAEVLYYYFEAFPRVFPYQHGKTIEKFAILIGEKTADSANMVGRYMYQFGMYSVSANAPFLGNLHADFGIPGVLVGGFLAGVILQVIQIYLVRQGKSILSLTTYAIFVYKFTGLSSTALPIVLLSDGPIFIVLLGWTMTAFDSMILSALRIHRSPHPESRYLGPT